MKSTDFQAKNLRSNLPRNWRKSLQKRLNNSYSVSYIEKVIYGIRSNDQILFAALALVDEENLKKRKIEDFKIRLLHSEAIL